uniref:Rhomboid-related protein 1-like isoform X2 n=1 Tax=Diabrotica virgifera virgifera TaxID=50390 RepID=A0A6P7GR23_DIAVI
MGVLSGWLDSSGDQEQDQNNIMEQPIEIFRNSKILSDEELKEYYLSVFNCCDANKDGLVSIFELKTFLETQEHIDIPDNVLECLYNKFDTNKDRQLDFEEFLLMINDKTFKDTFRNIATSEMHLYSNVIVQIVIGIPLEMVHSWRVIVVYIVGAIGGCLAHSVLDRFTPHKFGLDTISTLRGASGGVFSIFTAHIASVIMNWREMTHPAVHLLIFGVVIAIDVVYSLFRLTPEDPSSYLAHAGGAVVGLLFGVNILRNLRVKKVEKIIWFACLITLSALFAVFITLDAVMKVPYIENNATIANPVKCH